MTEDGKRGVKKGSSWSDERRAAFEARKTQPKVTNKPKVVEVGGSTDRASAVADLINTLSVPMMVMGNANDAFLADALTLQLQARPIGEAMARVAEVNPAVAAFIDSGSVTSPYLLLGSTLLALGSQLASNHGIKIGFLTAGTHPKSVLVTEMRTRMEAAEMQRQADEAAAQEFQKMMTEPEDVYDQEADAPIATPYTSSVI
jgi:hypothetical protein